MRYFFGTICLMFYFGKILPMPNTIVSLNFLQVNILFTLHLRIFSFMIKLNFPSTYSVFEEPKKILGYLTSILNYLIVWRVKVRNILQ